MAEHQRPTMIDQDWQRLREVLEQQAKDWESYPPNAQLAEGMRQALRYMDAVEADAATVRGVEAR
jgi:hypothetical protein